MRVLVKLLVLPIAFLLSGCIEWVESNEDLKRFVAEVQSTKGGKVAPLPEFKPYQSFVYEGATMREPFVPLVPIAEETTVETDRIVAGGVQPDEEREKEYLETFSLDQLKMVGTITKPDSGLWALIADQNGEIHRVTVGSYMGLDFGKITNLDERKIELNEIVTNGRGGWMKRPRNLVLNEQE